MTKRVRTTIDLTDAEKDEAYKIYSHLYRTPSCKKTCKCPCHFLDDDESSDADELAATQPCASSSEDSDLDCHSQLLDNPNTRCTNSKTKTE